MFFFCLYLVAVAIAFIICYAPFHAQRLITSNSNVAHLSLIERRAITIFYFISGVLYYLGSTINPIFYHLFSRKYRETCIRTMKRIIYCQHHHKNNHFHRTDQCLPVRDLVLYANTHPSSLNKTKTLKPVYRSPKNYKASLDIRNKNHSILNLSLPAIDNERI